MSETKEIEVHTVKHDGLPPAGERGGLAEHLVGCVAFVFHGEIIRGYPTERDGIYSYWDSPPNYSLHRCKGVRHWVEFPTPIWDLTTEGRTFPRFHPPYGYCPHCGSRGMKREHRIDGNDTCEEGHVYPSKAAAKNGRYNE